MKKQGIILFAHGSRDPRWAQPFELLAATLSKKVDGSVRLAYLEAMRPSLAEAVDSLVAEQVDTIRVVPVFLAQGGHVSEDLPRLIEGARRRHPGVSFELDPPIGEQAPVLEAIAKLIAGK